MAKIAVLGAGILQNYIIDAIHAKGHTAVAFDGNAECASVTRADEFVHLDFSDRESVLKECASRNISGILTYASDAAAPIVSYVAEKLSLPCNPFKSVEILTDKAKTRTFLEENGFNVPKFKEVHSLEEGLEVSHEFEFPYIVKPIDGCGSRGFSKITCADEIEGAIREAFSNSRKGVVILEEFIERSGYFLEVECYLKDGEIFYFEPMYQHRDEMAPYSPIGDSLPIDRRSINGKTYGEADRFKIVKEELQRIYKLLDMKYGIYNVEFVFDKDGKLYFMEIAPRAGGNLISEANYYATGFNMREALVASTLGEEFEAGFFPERKNVCCLLVHSDKNGVYSGYKLVEGFKGKVLHEEWFVKPGDEVYAFTNGKYGLGLLIIEFQTREDMLEVMDNSREYVKVVLA